MGLRAVFLAALALTVLGAGVAAADDGYRPSKRKYVRQGYGNKYRVQPGHGDGEERKPYIYVSPYSNSPYFDNRTFWERVESGQPDYPVR